MSRKANAFDLEAGDMIVAKESAEREQITPAGTRWLYTGEVLNTGSLSVFVFKGLSHGKHNTTKRIVLPDLIRHFWLITPFLR